MDPAVSRCSVPKDGFLQDGELLPDVGSIPPIEQTEIHQGIDHTNGPEQIRVCLVMNANPIGGNDGRKNHGDEVRFHHEFGVP